jgi:hypothetical protein
VDPSGHVDSAPESSSLKVSELHEFKFDRVLSDPALAPERRGFQDRLAVPLLEEAKGPGIAVRQIALS